MKTKKAPTAPEREIEVVAVGDLHCGSKAALCPPRFKMADQDVHEANPVQLAMFNAWKELTQDWKEPDILICNGDAVEGQARKESGVPCWTNDFDDQVRCAADLIRMFKPKKTYMVNGTGYHVDASGKSVEYHLGKELMSEEYEKGVRSGEELFLRVGKFTFHASHHISVGTGWYKTTPLARELVFALLNESDKHRADIFLRSHVHYFAGIEFNRQHGYILPCWQAQTRYMIRKSAFGMIPTIGALRFRIRWDEFRLDKRFFKFQESKPKLFVYER